MTNTAAELALGRILRLLSRPTQPGDVADYYKARNAFLSAIGKDGALAEPYRPDYTRDRHRGAQGDA